MLQQSAKWFVLTICTLGLLYCSSSPVAAADIPVRLNGCSLIDAITAANLDQAVGACPAGSGADKIILQDNMEISTINNTDFGGGNALPTITSEIRIEGHGYKISRRTIGTVFYRILSVAATGDLVLWQVTLADGRFQGQPGAYGAGIYNRGHLDIGASTLSGHKNSMAVGGAIYNEGTLVIQNSTVSENWSGLNGGAIYNKGGNVLLQADTFSGNSTINSGGSDIYNDGGNMYLSASILANSIKAKCGGLINSQGYNLVADGSCNLARVGDHNNIDPLLGPLRDNGGSTLTHSLYVGSPALDIIPSAGFCTQFGTDQRGVIRPQGSGCDIGALEVSTGADITPPTISVAIINPNATGWYNRDVGLHYTCADNVGGSGLAANACPVDISVVLEKSNVVSRKTVSDLAGNVSQPSNELTVNIDRTVPTIWAMATTNANATGWYNHDVTIHFICADALSGVASCPADQTLSTEGAAVSSTPQTVIDRAGNTATSNLVTVKIDKRLSNPPPASSTWQVQPLLSRQGIPSSFFSALVLDRDGKPIVLFNDIASEQLWLLHCSTLACTSGTNAALVDGAGNVGRYNALVLDSSGNPVVSYYDATNQDLKVRHCTDANCAGGSAPVVVDSVGSVGLYPSMQLDRSGNPVISYLDGSNGDLKVVHCGNADCSSGNTIQSVDSDGVAGVTTTTGFNTSLVLDNGDNPVVSYYDNTNADLKVVHCGNPTCTNANTIQTLDSTGDVGRSASLKLDSAGNPVISYYDTTNSDLKVVHCGNPTCTNANTIQLVDGTRQVGDYTALVLDRSGNPVISYFDISNGDLKLARCGNATCTSGNTFQIADNAASVTGQYSAMTLDSSGNPVITYQRMAINIRELRMARLLTDATPPIITPNVVAPLGNNGKLTVNWLVVDGETTVTSQSGCTPTTVTPGTGVVTLTCLATSPGGTSSHSITAGSASGSQAATSTLSAANAATNAQDITDTLAADATVLATPALTTTQSEPPAPSNGAFTLMLPLILVNAHVTQDATVAALDNTTATVSVTETTVVTPGQSLSPIAAPMTATQVVTEQIPVSVPVAIVPAISEGLSVSVPVAVMPSTVVTATPPVTTTQNVTSADATGQNNALFLPFIGNANALAGTAVGSLEGITPFMLVALVLIAGLVWMRWLRR